MPPPVPETDLSDADWLASALTGFGALVRHLVPPSYAAYARVLHRPDQGVPHDDSAASWAEVAGRHGTVLHPAAQWTDLARVGQPGAAHEDEPMTGSVDQATLPALVDVLGRHTATADRACFALWHGFGSSPASWREAPTFRLPGREYWLFRGPLSAAVELSGDFEHVGPEEAAAQGRLNLTMLGDQPGGPTLADQEAFVRTMREHGAVQSPSLMWPADRAWCVASEIDLDSTVVAGSAALVDELLDAPGVEALRVGVDTSLMANGDTVNRV